MADVITFPGKKAPPALTKRGIRTVRDDLPAGAAIDWGRDFADIFRDELMQRFVKPCSSPSDSQ